MHNNLKKNERRIICIDCGKPRVVTTSNWKQVLRCKECQYDQKRWYNSQFVKKTRSKE